MKRSYKDAVKSLCQYSGHLMNIFYIHTVKFAKSAAYHMYFFKIFKKQFDVLNLGSGTKIKKFLNIDANPLSWCDVIARIEKLKLKSNSVGIIYSSHVLEHIPSERAQKALAEWYRVLKPGGKLYISVPDLEFLFRVYLDNLPYYHTEKGKYLADRARFCVYGAQRNKYDIHCDGYSFITLKHVLELVGFKNVQRFDRSKLEIVPFFDTSLEEINGHLLSLNVEALK